MLRLLLYDADDIRGFLLNDMVMKLKNGLCKEELRVGVSISLYCAISTTKLVLSFIVAVSHLAHGLLYLVLVVLLGSSFVRFVFLIFEV